MKSEDDQPNENKSETASNSEQDGKQEKPLRRSLKDNFPDMAATPEEGERMFQERGGRTHTVTFIKHDPKTGKPPVLKIVRDWEG